MKKRLLTALSCCLFLAIPAVSFGATGLYGSLNGGAAWAADGDITISGLGTAEAEYETGYTFGGAIGYMMDQFRIEGEISYQKNDMKSIGGIDLDYLGVSMEVSALAYLVNGYYDFNTGSNFTPYVTAGLGAATIKYEASGGGDSYDDDDTVFAYQVGVGVGFAVSETVTLDLRYRYLGAADAKYNVDGDTVKAEIASHNISAGIRVAF